jgi:hypothetical protein
LPSAVTAVTVLNDSLVWLIEPEFEYERIFYCAGCSYNLFGAMPEFRMESDINDFNSDENIKNFKANLDRFNYYGSAFISEGHGMSTIRFFFDEKKEIFVVYRTVEGGINLSYYTIHDFSDNYIPRVPVNYLIPVRQIDSEKIIPPDQNESEEWYDLSEAVGEKYALMYGEIFITDFIYDNYEPRGSGYAVNDLIDMQLNGKWGIIDKNGNVAIPFLFDDIEFLNDDIAFAKYGGKYGVLDLRNTITIIAGDSPVTDDNMLINIIYILIISVILIIFAIFNYQRHHIKINKNQ